MGGLTIIACILGMLVFIGGVTWPLIRPTKVHSSAKGASSPTAAPLLLAGWNEYRELALRVDRDGRAEIQDWTKAGATTTQSIAPLVGEQLTVATLLDPAGERWLIGTASGRVAQVSLLSGISFSENGRAYAPELVADSSLAIIPSRALRVLGATQIEDGFIAAAWAGGDSLSILSLRESTNLLGTKRREIERRTLPLPTGTTPTALAFESEGARLFVGTAEGRVLDYDPAVESDAPQSHEVFARGVTALALLNGGHSLVIGGAGGEVEVWFRAHPTAGGSAELVRAHRFKPFRAPIEGIAPSKRDRSFLAWDSRGDARLEYATSQATRARFKLDGPAPHLALLGAKGDGILAADRNGAVQTFDLVNPHPELSTRVLLGKVQYEGTLQPAYVWQSTGASDDYEPKLSLVPLIFGTFKGAFYALLFSVPLAILAATYTSLFLNARLRAIVKPTMEMMAALPSVVLGFLAALWLAPHLERALPGLLLLPLVLTAAVLGFGALYRKLPASVTSRLWAGTEMLCLVLVLALTLRVTFTLNQGLNELFPGGFASWLYQSLHIRYDQRNALVIGIAMGIAVIPIVFTISEDSINNVPRALWAGSLALGASPWQTALRVMLPAASPGIFSAVMIGLGRAVGETMIVLMATGNTPIMDWLPWNGFRTLAANIAVEIPEAPQGGTLYRLLFLTALILFALTFIANTAAEVVRQRLRQRYSRF